MSLLCSKCFSVVAALALVTSAALAVEETPTSSTRAYKLAPGTRLVYETSGTLQISGDVDRLESGRFRSTFTVLEQRPEGRVILAQLDSIDSRTSDAGATQKTKPAARFTLSLPPEGAVPGETIQTAGLVGAPFKGWKFESIFPPIPNDGKKTDEEMVEMVGGQIKLAKDVSSNNGVTLLKAELAPGNDKKLQQHSYEIRYAEAESSVLETSQTSVVEIEPSPGMKAVIHLAFETKRVSADKVPDAELQTLIKDVAAAVPLAARLRSMSMAGEDAVEQTLKGMEEYVVKYPNGAFASLYQDIREQVSRARSVQQNSANVAEGKPAPDFEGTSLDGKQIKLSALRGKVVLLDFWATWCGPCVGMVPEMKRLFEANEKKPFQMIGISADHEESALRDFVRKRELKWPQVYEGEGTTSGSAMVAYGITKFPTTVLIDAQGQIRKVDAHGDELSEAVSELVSEVN